MPILHRWDDNDDEEEEKATPRASTWRCDESSEEDVVPPRDVKRMRCSEDSVWRYDSDSEADDSAGSRLGLLKLIEIYGFVFGFWDVL